MDDNGVGLIAWILIGVGGIVATLGVAGGVMYATDATVGAVVIDKECKGMFGGGTNAVTVETKFPVPGLVHTVEDLDTQACNAVNDGNYVEYHIRSGRTILYQEEGGQCIFDTANNMPCLFTV